MAPPPKKPRKMKNPSDHEERLEASNSLQPAIRNILVNLMFSAGDSERPLTENEDFLMDLLKNELVQLLHDVLEVSDKNLRAIKLSHLLPILKTQGPLISRFLKYLENMVGMASYMKSRTYGYNCRENICGQELDSDDDEKNEEEDGVDPMDEIGDVDGEEGEYFKKKRKKMSNYDVIMDEVRKAFKEAGIRESSYKNVEDESQNVRNLALQTVIQEMTSDEYNRFALARRTTFQDNSVVTPFSMIIVEENFLKKRRREDPNSQLMNNRQILLAWLGNPPINGESTLIFISFLAKELISEVVGAALVERQKMSPTDFGPLKHCYYEEVFRKNARFRKYGRFYV